MSPSDPAVSHQGQEPQASAYPFVWWCGCVLLDKAKVRPCAKHWALYDDHGVVLKGGRETCPHCHREVARYGQTLRRHKNPRGGEWCPGSLPEMELQHD